MPRYQFDLVADVATATALVQLAMESASQFSFRIVEEGPIKVIEGPKTRGHTYVKGTSVIDEVWKLCHASTQSKTTKARIRQVIERLGFSPNSGGPAMSLLCLTGLFERTPDGIRMLSDKTTLEQALEASAKKRTEWKKK